jgi:non-ribosomal peptide synthetase component F
MLSDLNRTLSSMAVTFLGTTPTVHSLVDPTAVPTLASVFCGGEALTAAVREKYLAAGVRFFTGCGPTETTVISTFTELGITDDVRTIGRALGTNRIYILDENLDPTPVGAAGRMWIGGPQLSLGYLGRPDLTAKAYRADKFVEGGRMYDTGDLCSWTAEGQLLYHGRIDGQIKIRGQRVEIGEIETALRAVVDCVEVHVMKRAQSENLLAFIIPHVSPSLWPRHFNADLNLRSIARQATLSWSSALCRPLYRAI